MAEVTIYLLRLREQPVSDAGRVDENRDVKECSNESEQCCKLCRVSVGRQDTFTAGDDEVHTMQALFLPQFWVLSRYPPMNALSTSEKGDLEPGSTSKLLACSNFVGISQNLTNHQSALARSS